ncbi:MAG TPA: glutamate synthase central domain-containing protein, partial [Mycobacteriales bacterium]|nr:glutamate synthase central domain-containing protein [Mycobacteriales bacterium]
MRPVPAAEGLYDPANEHDACGVAFVVDVQGRRQHEIIKHGLTALRNLDHRGAAGCDPETGDGAGILVQVPDEFLRASVDFPLPVKGAYAVGAAFLPVLAEVRDATLQTFERIVRQEQLAVVGWRVVPVDHEAIGVVARSVEPVIRQVFLTAPDGVTGMDLERRAYRVRKRVENEADIYFPSLSSRTLVYKGMLTPDQLSEYYPDLHDERFTSALALVHSRFSTNTFPSWPLAHPYRMLAHNGEINTVRGNRNWMRAREALLASDLLDGDGPNSSLGQLFPICADLVSDSASFDDVLELLHLGGRSLPHAVMMMVPEAWENNADMDPALRDFYRFHASLIEPWDGPAAICFTDGELIGATLDRNGLRPCRYWVTHDGLVVMASEVGVLDLPAADIKAKGRLQPGRMFLVDTAQGRIVDDAEIKGQLAHAHPYGEWVRDGIINLSALPEREHVIYSKDSVTRRQQAFGYTEEELRVLLAPMAQTGAEPIGSMGTDTPIAVLSTRPRLLFDYFTQLFAQVTNPPLDAIREELVTSLGTSIGPERNLLDPTPASCRQVTLP